MTGHELEKQQRMDAALDTVLRLMQTLTTEQRERILRTVAIWYDIEVRP